MPVDEVVRLMPPGRGFVSHQDAVAIGRSLVGGIGVGRGGGPLLQACSTMFADVVAPRGERHPLAALALSSTVHVGLAALIIFLASLNFAPQASALRLEDRSRDMMRLVFLQSPGPGGGGGGGGLQQPTPPPKAMREGTRKISSPIPLRKEPKPIVPAPVRPEPKQEPPKELKAEPLPVVVAPIIAAPADARTRIGVLEETPVQADSHGPGKGGGAGSGTGTGLGSGDGSGVGPGSGGGTGGGPYRPGSGIDAPRLLREVRASSV